MHQACVSSLRSQSPYRVACHLILQLRKQRPFMKRNICLKGVRNRDGTQTQVCLTPEAVLLTFVLSCYRERKRGTPRTRGQGTDGVTVSWVLPVCQAQCQFSFLHLRTQSVKMQVSGPKAGAEGYKSRVRLLKRRDPIAKKLKNTTFYIPRYEIWIFRY